MSLTFGKMSGKLADGRSMDFCVNGVAACEGGAMPLCAASVAVVQP